MAGRSSYPKSRGAAEEASQSAAVQRARPVTASLASGSAARLETSATRRNIKGLIASVHALRALPIKCAAIRSVDATEHGHALANHPVCHLCRGGGGRYPGRIGAIAILVPMVWDQGPQRRDVLLLHQLGTMPGDTVRNRRPLHPEPLLQATTAPASTAAHRRAPKVSFWRANSVRVAEVEAVSSSSACFHLAPSSGFSPPPGGEVGPL
jgi:hypothetical protein